MNDVTQKFLTCFSDDIGWLFLDVTDDKKEEVIKRKESGDDEGKLLEILVRR